MKAITTKYYGPTNSRGSRITASDSDGNRVSIPYDDGTNDNHLRAAKALCAKMKWNGADHLVEGGTKEGSVFVFLPPNCCPCCEQTKQLIKTVASLLEWAKGSRGRKDINPYSVPEVSEAFKTLADITEFPGVSVDVDTKKLSEA